MLNNIRIVLVETTHPGNIGAAARAMKTMGLSELYLVKPCETFPNTDSTARAAGADDILVNAKTCDSLDIALADCGLIIGTSARHRRLSIKLLEPHQCGKLAVENALNNKVAIIFGREHAGLTNEELNRCHYHVNIPSNKNFSSLNLAAAVQIISYEIRINSINSDELIKADKNNTIFANDYEVQLFYKNLQKTLSMIDFLKADSPRKLMPRLQRLFNRVNLEKMELDLLMGIFNKIQQKIEDKSS